MLSDDTLVWTAVFIDLLDGFQLSYWSFKLIGLIEYLTIESFMRYLIKVGLIEYLTVESFMVYLIKGGLIKYLTVESFMRYFI